jgi:hypothetical protein
MIPGARWRRIARVIRSAERGRSQAGLLALIAGAMLLLVAAVAVRGIAPARVVLPKDVKEDRPRIAEPMQLLASGAGLRAPELDLLVDPARRNAFKATRQELFRLQGCPPLVEWIDGVDGQSFERLMSELRAGTREEAFASLALVFRLARATQWRPGVLAHSEHAERLGALLQDWLRVWGEKGARDPLLYEPVLAATLVYGHVMRTAWRAPLVGYNAAPYDRSKAFLAELTGIQSGRNTALGEALQARYTRAATRLHADKDVLSGLEEECAVLYPDLTGECSR